jgi:hypothetical protein
MYWVRSGYSIKSVADIQLLVRIFENVWGELTCKRDEAHVATVA